MPSNSLKRKLTSDQRSALTRFLNSRETADSNTLLSIRPDPAASYEPFPLTDMQEAFWIGRKSGLELSNIACHIYYELEAKNLHVEHFRMAWQRLIRRHDALRAIILEDGRQQILETTPELDIQVETLSGEETERRLEEIRGEMSHQVRPSNEWPLFEVRISQLTNGLARLHFSFDILIGDGQSIQILIRELAQLCENPEAKLPQIDLSLRDYQIFIRSLQDSEGYQRAEAYWKQRRMLLTPPPDLPLAVQPSMIQEPRFVRYQGFLGADEWLRLKNHVRRCDITAAGVLLTAFAEVLAAWSRSPRFTLNLTLFNRLPLHPQVHDIVGDFTSSCLFAIDTSIAPSFEEMARQLQVNLWEDLDHTEVSGVRVSRDLASERGEHPRAMPVVFTSHLSESQEYLPWPIVYGISQTPQVWIDHQVLERDGRLEYHWDAVEELFPPQVLEDMFHAYGQLLQRLAQQDEAWTEPRLPLLPSYQAELVQEVNATTQQWPAEVLPVWGMNHLEQLAVITNSKRLNYEELRARAAQLALEITNRGLQQEELVAVVMEKGWEQVVAVVAILEAGTAYVPLDVSWPWQRVAELLDAGKVRLVVTQSKWRQALPWPEQLEVLTIDDDQPIEQVEFSAQERQGKQLAYVIYTSGSTGKPKGVMIEHRGATNTVLDINESFEVDSHDRVLGLSSLTFDLSVYDIFGMLAAGAALVLPQAEWAKEPQHWVDLMEREQVTIWNTVPALMEMLVEYLEGADTKAPEHLRLILLSGDWIPVSLPERIKRVFPDVELVSLGGATEASIWSILYKIGRVEPDWKSIPYGKPMRNQHMYVKNKR